MNELESIRLKIRDYMNSIADHMASGGCEKHEDYIRLVGKVEALALIERDVLDLQQLMQSE